MGTLLKIILPYYFVLLFCNSEISSPSYLHKKYLWILYKIWFHKKYIVNFSSQMIHIVKTTAFINLKTYLSTQISTEN